MFIVAPFSRKSSDGTVMSSKTFTMIWFRDHCAWIIFTFRRFSVFPLYCMLFFFSIYARCRKQLVSKVPLNKIFTHMHYVLITIPSVNVTRFALLM